MADTEQPVDVASQLMSELNIDDIGNEKTTLQTLVNDAKALINDSISPTITEAQLIAIDSNMYTRLVKTLATAFYYDRELSSGVPMGAVIMLSHFGTKVEMWEAQQSAGGVSNVGTN